MSDSQYKSEPTSKHTSKQRSHELTQPLPHHFAQLQGITAEQQVAYLDELDDFTLIGELEALLAVGDESNFIALICGR